MRYPIYIPAFEPRVRRRWWSDAKRARAIAKEAGETAPERFYLTLPPPHPNNPNVPHSLLFVVGHIHGAITFMTTTSSRD